MKTPLHPTLYSKTGVYKGIHVFLIFALNHRLWVLARTVMSKNKKNITFFHLKIIIFTAVKYHSILRRRVFVMQVSLVNEPRSEKTGLRGFRPGPTQTGLCSHRRWLEA